jgi:hypothetical protein
MATGKGFIVALAAYLATVARALKEKIAGLKENPANKMVEIEKHARNLALIIQTEAMLVWLGLLTLLRVIVGPPTSMDVSYFDYFLLVYLCSVIVCLAYLHVRQWDYGWQTAKKKETLV